MHTHFAPPLSGRLRQAPQQECRTAGTVLQHSHPVMRISSACQTRGTLIIDSDLVNVGTVEALARPILRRILVTYLLGGFLLSDRLRSLGVGS